MVIFADLVWPAMFLEARILTIWDIVIGLAIEGIFVYFIYRASLRETIMMTIIMNAFSTLIGIILIPLLGIAWEIFPGIAMYKLFGIGSFNPATWIGTVALATSSNTVLETWALKQFCKRSMSYRIFWLIFLANALSVGLALGSLYLPPSRQPGLPFGS